MDFKDIILLVGGLLIVAVVVHGFWIAWRARRDPLRMDLISESSVEDVDEMLRLRAELPNGGARVIARGAEEPRQTDLPLATADAVRQAPVRRGRPDGGSSSRGSDPEARVTGGRTEPRLQPPVAEPATDQPAGDQPAGDQPASDKPASVQGAEARAVAAATAAAARRDSLRAGAPKLSASRSEPRAQAKAAAPAVEGPSAPDVVEPRAAAEPGPSRPQTQPPAARGKVADVIMPERAAEGSMARQAARRFNDLVDRAGGRGGDDGHRGSGRSAPKRRHAAADGRSESRSESRNVEQPVEELIMISVVAAKGEPFVGAGLVEALRSRGLRYGDMNIFHRVDPMTRATLYSVANVVEPGTFDMADLEQFRSPGVCFFMQLPGPEHPMEAFEDMLKVARDVATRAGGELRDEQRSVMTGQTVEHYRQRISDFCRRR
ncbi:MAG: cell division protein ZipA, partial [Pseudomonadales bacterium]